MKKPLIKKNKKYKAQTSVLFWVLCVVVAVIVLTFILLGYFFITKENWLTILTSVTKDFITAIIVTSIVGAFIKMITEKFFVVKKNDKQLRKFGVLNVGTGVSTLKDAHNMFGYNMLNIYPQEIRMQYITGNVYLSIFKNEIIDCLEHGCNVKILLISTESDNLEFVHRLEEIYEREEGEFCKQIDEVKELVKDLSNKYSGQVSIRFFRDEYFYNFRSATYYDEKKNTMVYKSNINVQPFNKPAADCSIGLSGTYTDKDKLDDNIFYLNNKTFDKLWNKYEKTAY